MNHHPLSKYLRDYSDQAAKTDVIDPSDATSILQGLYGEVGGIMAAAKKHVRERGAYPGYQRAAEEEYGDALWYFAALCRRLKLPIAEIFADAQQALARRAGSHGTSVTDGVVVAPARSAIDSSLLKLGQSTAPLLKAPRTLKKATTFATDYLIAIETTKLCLPSIVEQNLRKTQRIFSNIPINNLADFDEEFDNEEQLLRYFRIRVSQRASGRTHLQWNGVFIGDPLTDNSRDPDGYRFHDVFHFAYAAVLHWSPVVRSILKQKRKSRPKIDEIEDGGRATVIEEGLTAWIFSRSKELNYFSDQDHISLDILKVVSDFVEGYEVSQCPPKLWERAILDGYRVFRELRSAEGGWIIGDRRMRTISYDSLQATR